VDAAAAGFAEKGIEDYSTSSGLARCLKKGFPTNHPFSLKNLFTMGILAWILFGLIAGAIAKAIRPGADPGGWIVTIIIGILGAVVGGWIGTMLGWGDVNGFNFRSFLLAIGGALLLLWIYSMVTRRRAV